LSDNLEPARADINSEIDQLTLKSFNYLSVGVFIYFALRAVSTIGGSYPAVTAASAVVAGSMVVIYLLNKKGLISVRSLDLVSVFISALVVGNSVFTFYQTSAEFQLILVMFSMLIIPLTTYRTLTYLLILLSANSFVMYEVSLLENVNIWHYVFSCLSEVVFSMVVFFSRTALLREQVRLKLMNDQRATMLEAASAVKDSFLANVTHELRTPLTGVLGVLDLLRTSGLNAEQEKLLRVAERSSGSLRSLIDDILDFSQLQENKLSLSKKPTNLKQLTAEICETMRFLAIEKSVELEVELPDEDFWGSCDDVRLGQVLHNLIGNAIKFTDHGSVSIQFTVEAAEQGQAKLTWHVKDTGKGISAENQQKLFNRFEQFAEMDKALHQQGSTGLGLAICKSLVDLMGGEIRYRDREKVQGSDFWFSIPIEATAAAETGPADEDVPAVEGAPIKILLAEDNKVNQMIIQKFLGSSHCSITTADNGQLALDIIEENPDGFDIVLMDVLMPVMGGLEAAQEIRERSIDVPIVAVSANASKADREQYAKAGMKATVAKPIDRETLIDVVRDVVAARV
jgi:signal transduction histidine kinase/ActR/RegA family two-component response regulator